MNGFTVTIGNVVIMQSSRFFVVEDCVELAGTFGLSCTCLVAVCNESSTCTRFIRRGHPMIVRVDCKSSLQFPHAWSVDGDHLVVLHPKQLKDGDRL